jgi:hypothetical protein
MWSTPTTDAPPPVLYDRMYAIKIDGCYLTSRSYYGNDMCIHLFSTKKEAQRYIDTYYSKEPNTKIKKVNVKVY